MIIVVIWLLAAMVMYLIMHWRGVLQFISVMSLLGISVWWLKPVILEMVDRAVVRWLGAAGILRLRGIRRVSTTRIRGRSG